MNAEANTRDLVSTERSRGTPVPGVLAVFSGGRPLLAAIELVDGQTVLGRSEAIGVVDDRVSRRHAAVAHVRGRWTITDHDSRNGTFVNGERVTRTTEVPGPRVVRLATSIYLLVDDIRPYRGASVTTGGDRVIGPIFARALDRIRGDGGDTLLVIGESGAGKELAARAFHDVGGGPFVAVNCAAIPEGVAERLLFGSVRGAYSGAVEAEGYIQAADGGVLFLDEIGELEPVTQAKLLRVLETREVTPLGASRTRRVTTRFCFATFRNLRSAIAEGTFRPDLYYRIARTEVWLPSLVDRREEIPWLIQHELASLGVQLHARFVEECLLRAWPGNVRELCAAARSAAQVALRTEHIVRPEHLDAEAGRRVVSAASLPAKPLDVTREQLEAALADHANNRTAAARALGLHRSQLYRLLKQFGFD